MSERSEKLEFENAAGERLAGRLELPAGEPRAAALFAHCFTCSKDVAAASRISRALARRGIAVLRFDFTGLGNSEGDFANTDFSSNVADLIAAGEHLNERGLAPKLLVGHSLGGAAVVAAASSIPPSRAVVTIAAPSEPGHVRRLLRDDLAAIERTGEARVALGGREFTIQRAFLEDLEHHDLAARARELRRALLILHSPLDEVVGIDHARRLFDAALHPKSFLSLDRADHLLSRREDSEYAAELIAAWSSRYVGAAALASPDPSVASGEVLVRGGPSGFTNEIRTDHHALVADEPEPAGDDRGPDPYELLLAALGACTSMTLRMYADRKQWPLEKVSVVVTHAKIHATDCADCETRTGQIDRFDRTLRLEGPLGEEQRARLVEIAERCPVHRTLEREVQIRTRLADPPTGP